MKFFILFALLTAVPVTSVHALEWPYTMHKGNASDRTAGKKNPFQTQNMKQKLDVKKIKNKRATSSNYNGDESGGQKIGNAAKKNKKKIHTRPNTRPIGASPTSSQGQASYN